MTITGMPSMDPIALRLLWNRLIGVVEEASITIRRCAFSTIVSEGNDCTAVLFDAEGHELAEPLSFTATSFVGTIPRTVSKVLEVLPPSRWSRGDVVICNDPWLGTGHLFDISMIAPIFYRRSLVGFTATVAHSADVGGMSGRPEAREVFEEGLRIPVCHLYRETKPVDLVFEFIRANVRQPEHVLGDLSAQVSAHTLMRSRAVEIMEEQRLDDWRPVAAAIQSVCRNAMRQAISEIVPAGKYEYEVLPDRIHGDEEVILRCVVEASHEGTMTVDYAGSSKQVTAATNCPWPYTLARTYYALKAVLLPAIPGNSATFNPIKVTAPPGCIVNPLFPAATAARSAIGHYLPSLVMGALGQVIPGRVLAEGAGPSWGLTFSGKLENGKRFGLHLPAGAGQGASDWMHGLDVVTYPGNPANTPIEILEQDTSLRVETKRIRRESGGKGRNHGGRGQHFSVRNTGTEPMQASFWADRTETPALGLAGGGAGELGRISIDGRPIDPKVTAEVQPGQVLVIETPGGGGYGRTSDQSAEESSKSEGDM